MKALAGLIELMEDAETTVDLPELFRRAQRGGNGETKTRVPESHRQAPRSATIVRTADADIRAWKGGVRASAGRDSGCGTEGEPGVR